jgi:hypothetical protein
MKLKTAGAGQRRLRIVFMGPPGSGKSQAAIRLARLLEPDRFAVVDTEQVSADEESGAADKLVSDRYVDDGEEIVVAPFDVVHLHAPDGHRIMSTAEELAKIGRAAIVIDSVSAEWEATEDALDQGGGAFTKKGREAKVDHRAWVQRMLRLPSHLILTGRVKSKFVEAEDRNGKKIYQRVGLEMRQDETFGYEVDFEVEVERDENGRVVFLIRKSRSGSMQVGWKGTFKQLAKQLLDWLNDNKAALLAVAIDAARAVLSSAAKAHGTDWALSLRDGLTGGRRLVDLSLDELRALPGQVQTELDRKAAGSGAEVGRG